MSESGDPGIGYLFRVTIDGKQLGVFTKVAGISAKYDATPVKEGGLNAFVHQLPGRVSYENIKLTRPVDADSISLAEWFTALTTNGPGEKRTGRHTASVTAFGPDAEPLISWAFSGVVPISYSGPSFQAGQSQVLTETIEFAHTGFRSERGSGQGAMAGVSSGNSSAADQALNRAGQEIRGMF